MSATSNTPPTFQQVCDKALSLPCSPALLPRLSAAILSHDSSADEIARIIMVDASLAASTLRLANSAALGGRSKVETVSEAVVRLGQTELYRLAALALVNRWESVGVGQGEPGDFCRHALCTALAAEALAEMSGRVEPAAAYTAGLVTDIGKLAVANACAAWFPALHVRCAETGCAWSKAEKDILGYTNGEVGARLLRAWQFPNGLVLAAEHGERPAGAPEEARPMAAHLHAAKFVATSFGPGVPASGFLFEVDSSLLTEWGFTSERLQETMLVVHERATARLQGKLTHGAVAM